MSLYRGDRTDIAVFPAVLLWLISAPIPARADSWSVYIQNDIMAGTDGHLTNRIGYDWISDSQDRQYPVEFQSWYTTKMKNLVEGVLPVDLQSRGLTAVITVGHDIVTPRDTSKKIGKNGSAVC